MRTLSRLFIFLMALSISSQICLPTAKASTQPIETTEESSRPCSDFGFAEFLFKQGENKRALIEYLRFGYMQDKLDDPPLRLRLGRTRLRMHQYEAALAVFSVESPNSTATSLADSLAFGVAASNILLKLSPHSRVSMRTPKTRRMPPMEYRLQMLSVLNTCLDGDWSRAESQLANCPPNVGISKDQWSELGESQPTQRMAEMIDLGNNLPRKSPALAGLMSAVVPSTGKLYVGRRSDAIVSLTLMGSAAWMSYRGFRDNGMDSIKGWSFATISSFFYLGNIYGSVGAAQNHNRSARSDLGKQLRVSIGYWACF